MSVTEICRSRQPGYTAVYATRHIVAPGYVDVVPTHVLASVLRPLLQRLNAELDQEGGTGAISNVAFAAARSLGVKTEAIPRRLFAILNGVGRATRATFADAVLLALNVQIGDTDIPTLPAGKAAALDRINCRCEERGIRLPLKVRKQLALDLLEFAQLVIHDGFEALHPELAEETVEEELIAA